MSGLDSTTDTSHQRAGLSQAGAHQFPQNHWTKVTLLIPGCCGLLCACYHQLIASV